ncbi:MAG: type II secretion system F family protein [Acidobacteriota bacterium]|nr:type II secretion system F family protein [Acidobacteriota bacterium]
MPVFKYRGKNKVGNIIEGERSGHNSNEIITALEKEQIQVLSIERKKLKLNIPFIGGKKSVSLRTLAVFNRQLSVMFNAGLPITQAIGILGTQQKDKFFKDVLLEVRKDVEAGSNLSNAMKKHPKVFNDLYTSMIQAGEASGNLDTILLRLSQYVESITKLVGKVKSALTYPIAVIVIALVLTGVLLWKVVPVFQDMFSQMGAELPMLTQLVVDASAFFSSNIIWIILFIIGLVFLFRWYYGTFKGRRVIDNIKLKIWVFGELLTKVAVARVTRTLATLLTSGVEIIESMTITAKTSGNAIIEDAVLKSRALVQEGKPLWESWEETKRFPYMVTQMVAVGEQTGSLSTMLGKVADFYDEEVDQAVSAIVSLMEPLMIVVLGGIVGTVVVAMYLPLFDIIGKVG